MKHCRKPFDSSDASEHDPPCHWCWDNQGKQGSFQTPCLLNDLSLETLNFALTASPTDGSIMLRILQRASFYGWSVWMGSNIFCSFKPIFTLNVLPAFKGALDIDSIYEGETNGFCTSSWRIRAPPFWPHWYHYHFCHTCAVREGRSPHMKKMWIINLTSTPEMTSLHPDAGAARRRQEPQKNDPSKQWELVWSNAPRSDCNTLESVNLSRLFERPERLYVGWLTRQAKKG